MAETPPRRKPATEAQLTRRALIAGGTLAGIGLAIGLPLGLEGEGRGPQLNEQGRKLVSGAVTEGLSRKWQDVVLFAGFMGVRPGTPLYRDPFLTDKLDLPFNKDVFSGVLRPFFANASLGINFDSIGDTRFATGQPGPIKDSVLGFLPPASKDVVYLDYDPANVAQYARNRWQSYGNGIAVVSGLMANHLTLDGRKAAANGQTVAYLEDFHNDYYSNSKAKPTYKLCGVSVTYATESQLSGAVTTFLQDDLSEPITLQGLPAIEDLDTRPRSRLNA